MIYEECLVEEAGLCGTPEKRYERCVSYIYQETSPQNLGMWDAEISLNNI
jgi:hypothetical protein